MRVFALLSLVSLAASLPASVNLVDQGAAISVLEREVGPVEIRAPVEEPLHGSSALVARALYDQTVAWPETSVDLGNLSFQVSVTNLNNGKYRINWWNSDARNSQRKIKLTFNSGSGARLYDVVTSTQTRGSAEVTKTDSTFRVIFDQE
ncbi:uncharacterized protein CTRU02_204802 [Colletotrichum truncatum]|uniref:Uncharacterized protein n=1 Tax=Colletotrichum truncatum TaxID=5467 RepID=A0ACC3ZD91_COLTU|nr:uncharacterized protein CTRU02_03036 [Colletotrichum truncatum]KAF6797994.1 hypothetical protein CTRU02_03036 [Colletotrichum truncatum]